MPNRKGNQTTSDQLPSLARDKKEMGNQNQRKREKNKSPTSKTTGTSMVITWVIKTSLATLRAVVPCLACPGESEKNKGNKRNGVSFLCHTGRDGKRRKVEEESKLLYKNTEPDSGVRRRTMCCDASQDRSPLFLRPVKVALRGRRSRLRGRVT